MTPAPKLISTAQAAEYLGPDVTVRKLRRLAAETPADLPYRAWVDIGLGGMAHYLWQPDLLIPWLGEVTLWLRSDTGRAKAGPGKSAGETQAAGSAPGASSRSGTRRSTSASRRAAKSSAPSGSLLSLASRLTSET